MSFLLAHALLIGPALTLVGLGAVILLRGKP